MRGDFLCLTSMKTTIEVLTFKVRKHRSFDFLSFSEEPDLYELLANDDNNFVNFIDKNITGDVEQAQRTVRIPMKDEEHSYHHHNDKFRYICGIIETGLYGKEYEIADKDTPKLVEFRVSKNSAIIKPFFYFIMIPRKGDKGLIILERTDNDGIFPLMKIILTSFINNHYGVEKGYTIEKSNLILGSYIEELMSGRYSSISLSANSLKKDIADRYFGVLNQEDFSLEFKIKIKGNLGLDKEKKIKKMIKSGEYLFDSKDLKAIFEESTTKVVSTVGDGKDAKSRTFYLNEDQHNMIRPYYDIEVKKNIRGFSDYLSIKEEVKRFIKANKEFETLCD